MSFASSVFGKSTYVKALNPNKRQKIYVLNGEDFMKQQISAVFRDFQDGLFSDFKIIVENKEIPVHRIILKSASDKFEAMFDIEMKEKGEGRVVIRERSYEAVKAMVDYIYGNEIANPKEVCYELLEMADEYNIPRLKNDCEDYLKGRINHGNVHEILAHAHKYDATELMAEAIKYIGEFRKELISKEKCAHLNPSLKDLLLIYIANKY